MTWVRLDESFADHPKVLQAGPLGIAMQVAALCYSNKYLTDGFIPNIVLPKLLNLSGIATDFKEDEEWNIIGGAQATPERVANTLVDAGLWTTEAGGYRVHDYHEYQPSKAQVEAEREQKRIAGQAGGKASARARAQAGGRAPAQAKSKQKLNESSTNEQAESNPDSVPEPDSDTEPVTAFVSDSSISPPTPHKAGGRSDGSNPRANGTNPRALATKAQVQEYRSRIESCEMANCDHDPDHWLTLCMTCSALNRKIQELVAS